jgi:D-alanyl-D-alanine carboxypeptidase
MVAVDLVSGHVLTQDRPGQPRHPASLAKLMTAYLAFADIQSGKMALPTPLTVPEAAASQGGSTLGLKTGQTISLSDALTAAIVRSANDAAVTIAIALDGTEDAFARRMTDTAHRLGMRTTRFANATGMSAPDQTTSARDMAVLALALWRDFPAHWPLFASRSMRWRRAELPSVNAFLAGYPGADGLKTGFTCPAGYNLAASAKRGDRHVAAIVMGAASKEERARLAAQTISQAFAAKDKGDGLGAIDTLAGQAPDLSATVCAGGVPGDGTRLANLPKGWAIEVAWGRNRAQVARQASRMAQALRGRLGGGTPAVVAQPLGGGVRYRGLIAGLKQDKAVPVCLELRRKDEDACLVLPPTAVAGAADTERRLRMMSARD